MYQLFVVIKHHETITSQVIGFDSKANAEFSVSELSNLGYEVTRLYK